MRPQLGYVLLKALGSWKNHGVYNISVLTTVMGMQNFLSLFCVLGLEDALCASGAAPRHAFHRTWNQVIPNKNIWGINEIRMRCLKEVKVPGLEIAGSFEKLVVLEQTNLAEPKSFYWNSTSVELLILPGEIRERKKEAVWTRRSKLRVGPSVVRWVSFRAPSRQSVWAPARISACSGKSSSGQNGRGIPEQPVSSPCSGKGSCPTTRCRCTHVYDLINITLSCCISVHGFWRFLADSVVSSRGRGCTVQFLFGLLQKLWCTLCLRRGGWQEAAACVCVFLMLSSQRREGLLHPWESCAWPGDAPQSRAGLPAKLHGLQRLCVGGN